MGVYRCAICDDYKDDDWNCPSEYGDELICEDCYVQLQEDVEEAVGKLAYEEMKEEEIVKYHVDNL